MKKNMTFSADFVKSGYTKVSRQAMQVAFTPGNKCEKEAKVLLCILSFAHFRRGMVCVHFKDYVCERGEWISSYSELAFRTGMARKTVVTAVERLVEDGSLTVTPIGKKTKFTLTYYDAPPAPAQESSPKGGNGGGTSLSAALYMYQNGAVYNIGGQC